MAYQVSPNTCPVMVRIPVEDAAKLRTLAHLKSAQTKRKVSMSNFARAMLLDYLAHCDCEIDAEAAAWADRRRQKARAIRAKSDALTKAGTWRKPGWQEVDARRQERLMNQRTKIVEPEQTLTKAAEAA